MVDRTVMNYIFDVGAFKWAWPDAIRTAFSKCAFVIG